MENEKNLKTDQIAGTILGNLQSAENFADNVVLNAERGHGFAAEKANHLIYMTYFMGKMHKLSAVIMQKMVRIG